MFIILWLEGASPGWDWMTRGTIEEALAFAGEKERAGKSGIVIAAVIKDYGEE